MTKCPTCDDFMTYFARVYRCLNHHISIVSVDAHPLPPELVAMSVSWVAPTAFSVVPAPAAQPVTREAGEGDIASRVALLALIMSLSVSA